MYRAFGYRFYRNAPGKLSIPSPKGKGDRPQAVDEGRYSVAHCGNNRRKGKSTESHRRERPMCRSVTLQLQPLWTNRNHPPTCHSERTVVSRGIHASGRFYLVVVLYPTWWIPPLRLRYGRNDRMGGRFYEFAYSFWNVSRCPAPSSVSAAPSQLPPREAFVPWFRVSGVIGNGSVLSRAERHIGRSLRFRWWVSTFDPAG